MQTTLVSLLLSGFGRDAAKFVAGLVLAALLALVCALLLLLSLLESAAGSLVGNGRTPSASVQAEVGRERFVAPSSWRAQDPAGRIVPPAAGPPDGTATTSPAEAGGTGSAEESDWSGGS